MPITLFNPPCPPADPVVAGLSQRDGQRCGTCICVPRYWQLIASLTGDPYADAFLGKQILTRDLRTFPTDTNADCLWVKGIDLTQLNGGTPAFGSIQLIYTSMDSGLGTLGNTGWWVIFTGFHTTGFPTDVEVYGALGGDTGRWWKCLKPNTLPRDDSKGGGNFPPMPDSIVVQPFWP
ncbi:MAG: hypothetical protein HY290_33535 [Planctomycetia bacterium]|nr:hypothetical protein [Planctomycetia bacterium]